MCVLVVKIFFDGFLVKVTQFHAKRKCVVYSAFCDGGT